MKLNQIVALIFSLPYFIFGSNYFFPFIPLPPMDGNAGSFIGVLYTSNFLMFVKILELSFAFMIALNVKRELAILLIAPISLNIFLFEILIVGVPGIGLLLVLLNSYLIYLNRAKYFSIVQ
jgi:putative oxidoreductase